MVPDRGIGGSGDGDGQTRGTDIGWGGWGKPPSGMIIVVMVAHMSFPNLTPELYIYIYIYISLATTFTNVNMGLSA